MDERAIAELLSALLRSSDRPYLELREALACEPAAPVQAEIDRRRGLDLGAREILILDALTDWLCAPARCLAAGRLVTGDLGKPPPAIVGAWPSRDRVAALSALGPEIAPRLMEMVAVSYEAEGERAIASALGALAKIEDPGVAPFILGLLGRADRLDARRHAMRAAADLGLLDAAPPLVTILAAPAEDELSRSMAAQALGQLGAPSSIPVLESVLHDEHALAGVRASAASALALVDAEAARVAFHGLLAGELPSVLAVQIMIELGAIGDDRSLAPLERIAAGAPSLRGQAERLAQRIQARGGRPATRARLSDLLGKPGT